MSNNHLVPIATQKLLLANTSRNKKHYLMTLLMLDCGLRVSEVASLEYNHLHVSRKEIKLPSLKKRSDKPIYRTVPLTYRSLEALANYLYDFKITSGYVFPSDSKSGHIARQSIWRLIKRYSSHSVAPHKLRHTYATRIVQKSDIRTAQKLLGHSSSHTTEIYLHVPEAELIAAVEQIQKVSFVEKIRRKLNPIKKIRNSSVIVPDDKIFLGRGMELLDLKSNVEKRINTLVIGKQGIGKSDLLSRLAGEKILILDDMKSIKMTLGSLITHLESKGKKAVIDAILEKASLKNYIQKNSTGRVLDFLFSICDKKEYTLIIDDVTDITKTGVRVLEKMKDHFHLVVAARAVKIEHASFLTSFDKIDLMPLHRKDVVKLVWLLSRSFVSKIENYDAFKNYVCDNANGNPMNIREIVERLSKEQYIGEREIESVKMIGNKTTVDFSIPLVLVLSSLMVLRYIGGETGNDEGAYRLFGGAFMVIALFARSFFRLGKRKYI